MTVKWRGNEFQKKLRQHLVQNLDAASILVSNRAKRLLSKPNIPQVRLSQGATPAGLNPSAPGQPPKKVTGMLRASVQRETDPAILKSRVGTNYVVGRWLELGTNQTVVIRPKRARALTIPVGQRVRIRSKRGKALKNPRGEVDVIFRKWARRGPIQARPWLRPAVHQNANDIVRVLSRKFRFR